MDDNCNEIADEDYVSESTSCGVGYCAATGETACVDGQVSDTCEPGAPLSDTDATCDGVDDNCNEIADEGYVPESTSCGVGYCAATGETACVEGQVSDTCEPGAPLSDTDATCDGVDDNCNEIADEGYVPESTSCGVGYCAATGETACVEGQVSDTCEPGAPLSDTDATCDGVDDNCNEIADEDYVSESTSCGVGYCAATGETACVDGRVSDTCEPGAPLSDTDATCDGVDDNCNEIADEGYVPESTSCGVGYCAATGETACVEGQVSDTCEPGAPLSDTDATCDGVDDNCNEIADEGYVPEPTTCGLGICESTGQKECQDGSEVDTCIPGVAGLENTTSLCTDELDNDCDGLTDQAEDPDCGVVCADTDATCDGVDDDCDGTADEDYVSEPTSCGVGYCAATGETTCVEGQEGDTCEPGAPLSDTDATCDGVDDNCNETADEDYVSEPTNCGTGFCAAMGEMVCEAGQETDTCQEGEPLSDTDDTCDEVDDDCNGLVDDGDADGDGVAVCDDQCPGEDDTIDVNENGIPDCLNNPPTADAGDDLADVAVPSCVTLDGSDSTDPDGDDLTYQWLITVVPAGSGAYIDDSASQVMPDLCIDMYGMYTVELIVYDGLVDSDPDEVVIATGENLPPVADAGDDDSLFAYEPYCLDGNGSYDPNGDPIITYSWSMDSIPTGSAAELDDPTDPNPCFTPDFEGEYVYQLIVNDGEFDSDPDMVTITVDVNAPPVADPGPDQPGEIGVPVCFDGAGSFDPDNDQITFSWSLISTPENSAAEFDDPTAPNPCITPDMVGDYVAQLIVNDGENDSEPQTAVASIPPDVCDVRGDLDLDCDVDYDDYLIWRTAYGSCVFNGTSANYMEKADLDGDGCVTVNDYRIFRTLL